MHLLCVITNGEFISKTSIKPTYETGTTGTEQIESQTELQALTFSICLFEGLINGGGLYPGGLISRIIYSLANGWTYIRGGLKVGFYGMKNI